MAALAARTEGWVDPTGAVAAIDEAGHASSGPAGVLDPVPAQRARLLLAQGDLAGAARWAQESGLSPYHEPEYPREAGLLVLARVFLADGQAGRALRLLDRLHAAATAQDRAGSLVELGAVQALALAASGEQAAAMGALAAALVLACPRGHVRVFADEGAPMAALLSRLIAAHRSGGAAAGISHGCLVRLHRAFEVQQVVRRGPAPGAGIIDPLTSREQECCRSWLRAGRTRPSPRSW